MCNEFATVIFDKPRNNKQNILAKSQKNKELKHTILVYSLQKFGIHLLSSPFAVLFEACLSMPMSFALTCIFVYIY